MENRSHALATGAFVLLLGAALVVVVAWFQGDHNETVGYTVVSQTGVSGLNVKAPVKLRGVQIGKVASIEFDPRQPRQILVEIEVDKDAPVTATTTARLGYQGITGLSFIELADDGSATASLAPRDPASRIELMPSLLDRLANGGPRLLAGVNDVALRLSRLLGDENQREVSRTLAQLGEASGQISQLVQDLRPAAQALKPLVQQADQQLKSAGVLLHGADRTLQKFEALAVESTLLAQDLRQRSAALDRLALAANQLQATTQRLELAMVGADRPRRQPLVDALAESADSVRRSAANVGSLADQPHSVLFGRPALPPGPGEPGFDAALAPGKGR